jgi:hypothetical protein
VPYSEERLNTDFDAIDKRRVLMEAWSLYLEGEPRRGERHVFANHRLPSSRLSQLDDCALSDGPSSHSTSM